MVPVKKIEATERMPYRKYYVCGCILIELYKQLLTNAHELDDLR
jgi:hypothetical protein